jgi:hypothetical protein
MTVLKYAISTGRENNGLLTKPELNVLNAIRIVNLYWIPGG